jgi:hypothetical protein
MGGALANAGGHARGAAGSCCTISSLQFSSIVSTSKTHIHKLQPAFPPLQIAKMRAVAVFICALALLSVVSKTNARKRL